MLDRLKNPPAPKVARRKRAKRLPPQSQPQPEKVPVDHAKHTAFESKETYEDGKLKSKERRIGSSVAWAVVALVAILFGKAAVNLPPEFWEFFRR